MKSQDEILKQLIETNICQRGIGNVNAVKMGRCLKELERIEGIRNGGDRKSKAHNALLIKTQSDLADEIGISIDQYTVASGNNCNLAKTQDDLADGNNCNLASGHNVHLAKTR